MIAGPRRARSLRCNTASALPLLNLRVDRGHLRLGIVDLHLPDLPISDDNNVVCEVVKATGDILTVAGDGKRGYAGDNGPATDAELAYPRGLAVDSSGDVFIVDLGNNVVREVIKATGDIITVAG